MNGLTDEAYRQDVKSWLAEHAAEYAEPRDFDEIELVERSKAWIRAKHEAGYSAITEPEEAGGAGGSSAQAMIFAEEQAKYHTPIFTGISIGFNMAMAALRDHGTSEQYHEFAKLTHSGEISWCQLFSEPGAGSDLAGLRAKAVRDGDNWVVNGQKVWSSWAHHADWGILIVRTDPSVPKHNGLSFFAVDMKSPGIEVRPIRQITGDSDFNETFMTDVVIPDANRIGSEGGGWGVCMTVLASERNMSRGAVNEEQKPDSVLSLVRRATEQSMLDDSAVREKLCDWYVREQGLKHFGQRLRESGEKDPALMSKVPLTKLVSASLMQKTNAFLMDVDEYAGLFSETNPDQDDTFNRYLWSAAMRVAGGADEVLRNQLAERALGMPGEMRADKGVPFQDLPS
ncbi:MAG: acyl-CoA dehydrogenase family protein [Pseudomonadales bacterium]|nr:acyl-CoA dehydrogenase family protein [Pseudomonadales bacterium]